MRNSIVALVVCLASSMAAFAESPAGDAFDWHVWRNLAVQDGGRYKPLDTLAWEALRGMANRGSFIDPETGEKLNPTALYLAMLFDWQGWDQPSDPHGRMGMDFQRAYFRHHQPDKWDHAGLLRADFLELRKALGLAEDQKYISPLDLSQATFQEPHSEGQTSFLAWAERLARSNEQGLTIFEKKSLELAGKFWSYEQHRMGQRLRVIPIQGSQDQEWASIAYLLENKFDDQTDPSGALRKAKEDFQDARAAFLANSASQFNQAAARFIAAVREIGPQLGSYPRQETIDLEVAYNRWVPFRFAWVLTTAAFLCILLGLGTGWKSFYIAGWATYACGLLAMLIGFAMRISISGRAPVTNMYESVIYLGLGTAVLGLVFELIYRKRYVLTAAAAVTTVALILADNCPAVLDPSFRPLQPVLRSNFWLVTHVMSITLSYAALGLALGIANITLGYYLAGSRNQEAIDALSQFTYRALQVGVLLLAVGTILGGVWAAYAWGRFWGWDPKEVWALIALLGYLAVLHARYTGWVGHFGLAALSVICFSLVIMAWYGVNFVLGAGLHSYGFGGGGQTYVYGAVLLQFLYVAAASTRKAKPTPATQPETAAASLPEQASASTAGKALASGQQVSS